ncbi:MAG: ADP/ATP-dependent (S)-NAD(P)H-hydrate dehydratase, partial [Pyrinomonadaceae bacterium]
VLTPHLGEMRRLMKLESDAEVIKRQEIVSEFAALHNVFLVLKGARILIGAPSGQVFINSTGNPGSGTAGAGDTLTGIITGSLAQSFTSKQSSEATLASVMTGVYLGGLACVAAQHLGMRALTASDIREHLAAALCALDPEGERP